MTIPEIRKELEELSQIYNLPRLKQLADMLHRKSPIRKTRNKATPKSTQLGIDIRAFAQSNPDLNQREIARHFNVDGGRVSEALNNLF